MAKRILDVAKNNVNMVERPTTAPSVKVEPTKFEKHRTSLVFKKTNYEYLQKLQIDWSFERKKMLTIEQVLSEIIEAHEKNQ